jgi:peptidoglycan L-alanyl-D-glutamate endopeptidase CwlK
VSRFALSARSKSKLAGVHPDLVRVIERAIELTNVDFGVTEGLRSKERQLELVTAGASKTLNSRHITGHAVDLAAFVGAELRWDFGLYLKLAEAVRAAARELGTQVVWGACWEPINDCSNLSDAVAEYTARKKLEGGHALIDGPHFELSRRSYP